MLNIEELKKLSGKDKKNIAWHLLLSLSILFILGLVCIYIGLSYSKIFIFSIGFAITTVVCIVFLIASFIQHKKYLNELRTPYILFINPIKDELIRAQNLIISVEDEFPNITTIDSELSKTHWTKSGFKSYLSLKRLSENLAERIARVDEYIYSFSANKILLGAELINTPITFETTYDKHLIDHEMPDIPCSSWQDSLKFLIDQVTTEKENQKKKNPLNSL
jgi:hypothetical protein